MSAMIEISHLEDLPPSARAAIEAAQDRVQRAVRADDVEGIIGASKELIETVAKAVIDVLGGSYGSEVDLPKLAGQTLEALKVHPTTLQGRGPLRQLSQSLISVAQAVAELRNMDGTGHGRSARTNLDKTHALLIRDVASVWCGWVLATSRRAGRAPLDDFVSDIGGVLTLSRGKLPRLLAEIGLTELGDNDQRRVGLAVARRWSVNETFLPLTDVIKPLANGEVEYPPAFCEGAVEGLLLDHNGRIQVRRLDDIRLAVEVGQRLPGHRREVVFKGMAERIEDALPSYKFGGKVQDEAAEVWRDLAAKEENPAIKEALHRIAARFEKLRGESVPPAAARV